LDDEGARFKRENTRRGEGEGDADGDAGYRKSAKNAEAFYFGGRVSFLVNATADRESGYLDEH
jgi:hypothetical protein